MQLFIDPPQLTSTDIVRLFNKAWSASFARVSSNKKAIAERGWVPCNRNLLLYKKIQQTMTKDDTALFQRIQTTYDVLTDDFAFEVLPSPVESVAFQKSHSGLTIISNITDLPQKASSDVISLNYSSGNSAMVLETLISHHNINEARERNKKIKKMVLKLLKHIKKPKLSL